MATFRAESEWKVGWRIVAASAIANATGISLFFYTFNLFQLPMAADFGLSRSQAGIVQSLVIMAALGAPLIGWLADRAGFRAVFIACTLGLAAVEISLARWGAGFVAMAMASAAIGFIGGGASSVLISRPVSTHFDRYRGLALGLVGAGISLTTVFVPPWLEGVIAVQGWRQAYYNLAAIAFVIGLPLVLLLMPRTVSVRSSGAVHEPTDWRFLQSRDFWQMTLASMLISVATSGAIGHLSPMLQANGLSAKTAALGISTFAIGQLVGKLGGGWLLDRFDSRIVASTLNAAPALAFVLMITSGAMTAPLLLATGLLGLLQGVDISLFAFLVARRFPIAQFGTVLGTVHGFSWIGTAVGLIGFGLSYDKLGSYAPVQTASIGALLIAGLLLLTLRLPEKSTS
ncbi:MFS transporter [Novosphingobium sp.]|uniref:MFS transporter n=1 Tax=Novosphingobium sp. TaxID=1874826 RepID=UPI00286A85E0|nr:MFS transporter [Novosphingobium sp.]